MKLFRALKRTQEGYEDWIGPLYDRIIK